MQSSRSVTIRLRAFPSNECDIMPCQILIPTVKVEGTKAKGDLLSLFTKYHRIQPRAAKIRGHPTTRRRNIKRLVQMDKSRSKHTYQASCSYQDRSRIPALRLSIGVTSANGYTGRSPPMPSFVGHVYYCIKRLRFKMHYATQPSPL